MSTARKAGPGRPTRFPGKPNQTRLTVSLTPACRDRITELSGRMACSLSDVVEYSVWQVSKRLGHALTQHTITSTGGEHE